MIYFCSFFTQEYLLRHTHCKWTVWVLCIVYIFMSLIQYRIESACLSSLCYTFPSLTPNSCSLYIHTDLFLWFSVVCVFTKHTSWKDKNSLTTCTHLFWHCVSVSSIHCIVQFTHIDNPLIVRYLPLHILAFIVHGWVCRWVSCDYGMFVTQITGVGDAGTGGGSLTLILSVRRIAMFWINYIIDAYRSTTWQPCFAW